MAGLVAGSAAWARSGCFGVAAGTAFFATEALLVATAVAAARAATGLAAFFTAAGTDFAWARAADLAAGFAGSAFPWAPSCRAFAAVPDAFMPDTSYPSSAGEPGEEQYCQPHALRPLRSARWTRPME